MLLGFHHVTTFARDAQQNLDFYRQCLGLRLVKRTVNFDDPGTYHFYYGDARGTPGSLLTFFPWPAAPKGTDGSGRISALTFEFSGAARFAGSVTDPAGLRIDAREAAAPRIRSVTLREAHASKTAHFLVSVLGFAEAGENRFDLRGSVIEVEETPDAPRAKLSAGMIHHVAFRAADEPAQLEWRAKLKSAGVRVTRVIDRQYFKSIYFREPGGVLFEIATDGPGFLVDEPEEQLGSALKLPPWLDPVRESIERRLPEIRG